MVKHSRAEQHIASCGEEKHRAAWLGTPTPWLGLTPSIPLGRLLRAAAHPGSPRDGGESLAGCDPRFFFGIFQYLGAQSICQANSVFLAGYYALN